MVGAHSLGVSKLHLKSYIDFRGLRLAEIEPILLCNELAVTDKRGT